MSIYTRRLGPRVPQHPRSISDDVGTLVGGLPVGIYDSPSTEPTRILPRANVVVRDSAAVSTATCMAGSANLCEKPASSDTLKIPIILGVAVPLVGASLVLFYLHRRNVARMRAEERNDPLKSLDWGDDEVSGKKRSGGEALHHKTNQLSMDMNLSSPYLLAADGPDSRTSLHSLARTLKQDRDVYGMVEDAHGPRPSATISPRQRLLGNPPGSPNPFGDHAATDHLPSPPPSAALLGNRRDESSPPSRSPLRNTGASGMTSAAPSMPTPPIQTKVASEDVFDFQIDNVGDGKRQSPKEMGLFEPPTAERHVSNQNQPTAAVAQEEENRGRQLGGRQSDAHGLGQQKDNGLAAPSKEANRLSVGYRPLPPSEVTDTEDPEKRAERIRSFYKEYFEDGRLKEKASPLPYNAYKPGGPPQRPIAPMSKDDPYFDPASNAFVMPYAEPVTRRAMTPPPRGRTPVGPGGPRGPGRTHTGSIGQMGLMGLPLPPRVGGDGMRSRSGSAPGSRPGSRGTSRGAPQHRKPMPPPADLNTLPTPHKLKNDSVALLGSIDFAPPPTFAEHVAGRSQSPVGERKPYQLNVPVSSPLVGTFEEMPALPSPHLLRKSGTFTALDFAPPKKFNVSGDTASDAGSIRSNKTGISAVTDYAIRSGAGRVSKLPGDAVFTSAEVQNQLKPQWGMRP